MATYKELSSLDFVTRRAFLDQIVDVIQEDISGSATRQTYQVFVTGGIGPGVTSSLFQTVYDQAFTAETANPIMDVTIGLHVSASAVTVAKTGEDANGKYLFPSTSLMMREKMFMYQQFAQKLLGDSEAQFVAPYGSTDATNEIEVALFMGVKRLFSRDQIKRETFVMGFFQTGSTPQKDTVNVTGSNLNNIGQDPTGYSIYTDIGASSNKDLSFGGQVSDIVDASDTSRTVGLLFNDAGVVVLDLEKICSNQTLTGSIDGMSSATMTNNTDIVAGKALLNTLMFPGFITSASIDDTVDYLMNTRFGSGTFSAMTFRNITNINSSLITARLTPDEFNYSSNPTYVDADNRIVVIDEGQEDTQSSFVMFTTIGFYDSNDNLLAVAKTSRPIEKNNQRDLSITTRLDYVRRTRYIGRHIH